LPQNNPITPFQTGKDIVEFLRAQWAGLFQHFLSQQKRVEELNVLDQMRSTADTLKQLVDFLTTTERRSRDDAIKSILLTNHPAFRQFAKVTGTPYRVFFETLEELNAWLSARGWESEYSLDEGNVYEWIRKDEKGKRYLLALTEDIFDEKGRLKNYGSQWKDEWVKVRILEPLRDPDLDVEPDDIPF
jgi:hypothetical protein